MSEKKYIQRSAGMEKIVVVGSIFLVLVSLWTLHSDGAILAITLFGLALIQLSYFRSRKLVIIYCIAFILGPSIEIISIALGIWEYATPFFIGIPVFLPFLWGCAGLLIVYTYKILLQLFPSLQKNTLPSPKLLRIIFSMIAGTLLLWLLWEYSLLLIVLLIALALGEYISSHYKVFILIFVIVGIGGATIESISIWHGIWSYAQPSIGNIPLYLFGLWGNVGISVVSFYIYLDQTQKKYT